MMTAMTYRNLGSAGLKVSALCLGTMTFGDAEGLFKPINGVPQDLATQMVQTALAAGINYFDTADVYSAGGSERILGQALRDLGTRRSDVVIATKFVGQMGPGPNDRSASRGHMMDAVRASLDRLQLDYIDHYQVHQLDPLTPVEETLRGLDDLVSCGLVRYAGVSNWAAWQLVKASRICAERGWARIETTQAYYSIVGRDVEDEIVPALLDQHMGMTVWSPLAGGFLSGKFSSMEDDAGRWSKIRFPPVDGPRGFAVLDVMREVARRHDTGVAQIALAWLLARPAVCSVLIGAKSIAQLEQNIAAVGVKLSPADMEELDAVSAPAARYPGWMQRMQRGNAI
jgi:aryl-alcohol dehydrogenase-like predicted oxidoreductase